MKVILSLCLIILFVSLSISQAFAADSYAGSYMTLNLGSRGSQVSSLQQALNNKGFWAGSVDGVYGSMTVKAVTQFQKAKGLAVDGIAGSQTQSVLYGSYRLLKRGSRGTQVSSLQQALNNKGFWAGSVDGVYGSMTVKAVTQFQKAKGLAVDGIAGSQTQSVLYGSSTSRGTSIRTNQSSEDLYWLSRIIHAEAEAEPYSGKVAVGNVIINRVNSSKFPNTIKGVIFEYFHSIPQFSPVAEGTIYNTPSSASIQAAKDALNYVRPVGSATYFFNPDKARGQWIVDNKTYVKRIGHHVFYK